MTHKVHDIVTDRILAALDSGSVPWHRPWSTVGVPRNATTNRAYSGINRVLLGMASYQDSRWLTYKQATHLGGHVRKGEKSSLVVFWNQIQVDTDRDGEEATRTIPLLRYFNLFNVAQCEGLNLSYAYDTPAVEPIEAATAIVDGMPNRPASPTTAETMHSTFPLPMPSTYRPWPASIAPRSTTAQRFMN